MQGPHFSTVQPLAFTSTNPPMQPFPVPSHQQFEVRSSALPQGSREAQAPPITQHGYGYENDPRGPPFEPTREEEDAARGSSSYSTKYALAHESLQKVMTRHMEAAEATKAVVDAFWLGMQCSQTMDEGELTELMASLTHNVELCGKVVRGIENQL